VSKIGQVLGVELHPEGYEGGTFEALDRPKPWFMSRKPWACLGQVEEGG